MLEHVGMKTVQNEPPLPFFLQKSGVSQNPQVMRERDHLDFEQRCQIADIFRPASQRVDDSQPKRLTQRLEPLGTEIRLKQIFCHNDRKPIGREKCCGTSIIPAAF